VNCYNERNDNGFSFRYDCRYGFRNNARFSDGYDREFRLRSRSRHRSGFRRRRDAIYKSGYDDRHDRRYSERYEEGYGGRSNELSKGFSISDRRLSIGGQVQSGTCEQVLTATGNSIRCRIAARLEE